MARRWTISELSERVQAALSSGYEAPENGQVRAVPSQRTIRYYTTIGLLSRPAEMRGRTALYDQRHLAELVAIKRLQASGLTLAEVQERLASAEPDDVRRLAELDEPATEMESTELDEKEATPFWLERPASPPAVISTPTSPASPTPPAPPAHFAPSPTPPLGRAPTATLTGYQLAPGVTLLLDSREHSPLDPTELRRAAGPLLAALGMSPNQPT